MIAKQPPQPILATTRLAADLDRIVASAGKADSMWQAAKLKSSGVDSICKDAGVYCFVLPEPALPKKRTLILHGRTFGTAGAKRQLHVQFDYQPKKFADREDLVVYIGKAANIRARVKGHLSTNTAATTNQVLRGLVGCPHTHITRRELEAARQTLLQYGSVHYVAHCHENESADYRTATNVGECFIAERDLLEIKLIAAYAPPFNIKAER
jgi:hypothetical protein